ncbi:olfactory receptor 5P68-like [Pyxicephalus adspersus]|uniref:olfactory receptor 5P68-like n=1 Tax=Pyxicephalus adspersus TaxID=30357 RepID=UPI003B58D87F
MLITFCLCSFYDSQSTYKNNVTTIFLEGFHNLGKLNLLLFTLLLFIYIGTICGNLLNIALVSYSKTLHSPMYFLLSHLSISDIMLTTDIAPNMLKLVLHEQASISFISCITQFYFFSFSGTSECLLLMVMAYDRYLAICSPLHYASIMNHMLSIKLILASWLLSCIVALILTLGISQLQFCGPNTIEHFYCDLYPLVQLSCSDVSIVEMETTLLCIPVVVIPLFVIIVSYTYIVSAILKISSVSGRRKTFSTCSSHLTVVSIFYGTLSAIYVIPNEGQSEVISKILALLYTVFIPFLNPFIYSLRNKDMKAALRNICMTIAELIKD